MSIVLDILRTYRAPRATLRARVSGQVREDRALAVLMGGCVLLFVAQWPRLSREAHFDESISFDARLAGALFGWVLVAPLFFYLLALLTHMTLRLVGTVTTGFETRMALFWALLASSPAWLLAGLMAGFVGPGPVTTVTGLLAFGAFLMFWVAGTIEVSTGRSESKVI